MSQIGRAAFAAEVPAQLAAMAATRREGMREVKLPEGVTVIDTIAFNGRLIAATDAGVFEAIDGVAVLLKPEMPA